MRALYFLKKSLNFTNPIFGPKIMILKKLTLSVVFYVMHALGFVSKLRKNTFPAVNYLVNYLDRSRLT